MTDQRVYRWSGPELSLIELVLSEAAAETAAEPLRSLKGFEQEVSCLLEDLAPTSSKEAA